MLRKLEKICLLLEDSSKLFQARKLPVFSIASYLTNSRLSKHGMSPELIIDAGANIGQFSLYASLFFPQAQIHSFEPIESVYRILSRNIHTNPNITAHNLALGESESKISFNLNSDSQASSSLAQSEHRSLIFPEKQVVDIIEVQQTTLSSFLKCFSLPKEILLKIDVQGAEHLVLQGASSVLSQIDYILLEASVVPLYKGEMSLNEIITYTESLGYSLYSVINAGRSPKRGDYIEFDLLFSRKKLEL